jgi:hypothetical protein
MAIIKSAETGKLILFALMLVLVFSEVSCATGPLGSHGVDTVPAFANANEGVGR